MRQNLYRALYVILKFKMQEKNLKWSDEDKIKCKKMHNGISYEVTSMLSLSLISCNAFKGDSLGQKKAVQLPTSVACFEIPH